MSLKIHMYEKHFDVETGSSLWVQELSMYSHLSPADDVSEESINPGECGVKRSRRRRSLSVQKSV